MKKRGKNKGKIFLNATLRITPMLLIVAGSSNWILSNFGDDINHWKIMNNLKDFVIEDNDESKLAEVEKESPPLEYWDRQNEEENIKMDVSNNDLSNIPMRTSSELYEMDYQFESIDFTSLKEINESVNSWIYVEQTDINLPIVQGTDNDFYLHHDIKQNKDKYGTLFLDCHNQSLERDMQDLNDISIIYGHHMADGSMLADICSYKTQKFYNKHPFGVLTTASGDVYKLDFFAGVVTSGSDYSNIYREDFKDEIEFTEYFEDIKKDSTFVSDCEVEFGDKIIALVTCSYETKNSRYVLYARMTKQLELEQNVVNTFGK